MNGFVDSNEHQQGYRLADLYEVARRVRCLGARNVSVMPDLLMIGFDDPRIHATVRMEIEPWGDSRPGWYWYGTVSMMNGFIMGPLSPGRYTYRCPRPRQVIRGYQQTIRWEMRPSRRKMNKRR